MLPDTRPDTRVTIADVAREAGVSRQTISRVLNNKGEISPATLERVREVIERLGYRPSSIARGLATHKTLTIGLIVPDIANAFFSEIARGAEDAAHAAGYSLLLCNTVEDPAREVDALRTLEDKRVDGIVLCSSRLPQDELGAMLVHHPFTVVINRAAPAPHVRCVSVDDAAGAVLAVRHLLARGRRTIGLLAGPPASYSAAERTRGYRAALTDAGLPPDPALHLVCPPYIEGGRAGSVHLLDVRPDLDALYCHNDLAAVGALQACAALGRRVPDDVAIVGNDDILLAGIVTPALTTLCVDKRKIGAAAMQLLLRQIDGCREDCSDITFAPRLVIRASAP